MRAQPAPARLPAPEGKHGEGFPFDELVEVLVAELVEPLAQRVAELLAGKPARPPAIVGVPELAELLGVSVDTVRRHADELGVLAVGGERGRGRPLRFDVEQALAAWSTARTAGKRSHSTETSENSGRKRRPRPKRLGRHVELLPIRDEEDADERQ